MLDAKKPKDFDTKPWAFLFARLGAANLRLFAATAQQGGST